MVSSAKKKVLVVDDSDIVLGWVEASLGNEFEVVSLTSAVDVAATVFREAPDIVLVDVKMPVLRGEHIVALARDTAGERRMPVVLFSGLTADELAARAASCGADGYIQKTGDSEHFMRKVREFVEGTSPVSEREAESRRGMRAAAGPGRALLIGGAAPTFSAELATLGNAYQRIYRTRGSEVLQAMQGEAVSLLMVGPDLLDMTAVDLCVRVRAELRIAQVSIIFVGGLRDVSRAREAMRAGANAAFVQPFDPAALVAQVQTLASVAVRRSTRLLVRMEVESTQDAGFQVGSTHNLSSSGMLVESDVHLEIGSTIKLRFFLPGESTEVSTQARVVRIQPRANGKSLVALAYVNLQRVARDAIERFVMPRR